MPESTTTDHDRFAWQPDPWPPFAQSVSPIGPTPPDAAWAENDRASIRYERRLALWLVSALSSLGRLDADELIEQCGDWQGRPSLSERGPGVAVEHGLAMLLVRALRLLGQARGAPRRVWGLPLSALSVFQRPLGTLPPDADTALFDAWVKSHRLDGWVDTPGWWHARMEACRDSSRQPCADELAATLEGTSLAWAGLERGGTESGSATALEIVTRRGELIVIDAADTGRSAPSLRLRRCGVGLGCDASARAVADIRGRAVHACTVETIGEDARLLIRLAVAGIEFELSAETAIVMLRDSPADVTPDPSLAGADAEPQR